MLSGTACNILCFVISEVLVKIEKKFHRIVLTT